MKNKILYVNKFEIEIEKIDSDSSLDITTYRILIKDMVTGNIFLDSGVSIFNKNINQRIINIWNKFLKLIESKIIDKVV